jgi:hypothetical protein
MHNTDGNQALKSQQQLAHPSFDFRVLDANSNQSKSGKIPANLMKPWQ